MSFDNVWAMWQDEEETSPSPAIGFGGREKVAWDSNKMSRYFEKKLFEARWHKGFVVVNHFAMKSHFTKWRDRGKKTEEEVKGIIDAYMSREDLRGRTPGWRDFLYRAEAVAEALNVPVTSQEQKRTLLEEAWELGTLEAFQRAFPDNPEMAQEYYDIHMED